MSNSSSITKNMSPYWVGSVLLAIWFLFIWTPMVMTRRGHWNHMMVIGHLLGSYPCYLACLTNTLITPFVFHGKAKSFHTWVGRLGLFIGVFSAFPSGMYYSYKKNDEYNPGYYTIVSGIIGIIYLLIPAYLGWTSIREYKRLKQQIPTVAPDQAEELKRKRDQALSCHVYSMLAFFTIGCALPAGQRFSSSLWLELKLPFYRLDYCFVIALGVPLAMLRPFHYTYFAKSKIAVEGNPIVNLWKMAQKVLSLIQEGNYDKIDVVQLLKDGFYQCVLLSNFPGLTPTLISKVPPSAYIPASQQKSQKQQQLLRSPPSPAIIPDDKLHPISTPERVRPSSSQQEQECHHPPVSPTGTIDEFFLTAPASSELKTTTTAPSKKDQ